MAGTAPEHVDEVLRIVTGELELLADDGITDRELAVAKGNLRAEMLLAFEDSGARMGRLGSSLLLHGEVRTIDQLLARIEKVDLDEVHQAARRLVAAPRTLAAVGPFDADAFDSTALGLAAPPPEAGPSPRARRRPRGGDPQRVWPHEDVVGARVQVHVRGGSPGLDRRRHTDPACPPRRCRRGTGTPPRRTRVRRPLCRRR